MQQQRKVSHHYVSGGIILPPMAQLLVTLQTHQKLGSLQDNTWVPKQNTFFVILISKGRHYVGSSLGSTKFEEKFVLGKVNEWMDEVDRLVQVARVHPHAAYSAFIQGFINKLSFLGSSSTPRRESLSSFHPCTHWPCSTN